MYYKLLKGSFVSADGVTHQDGAIIKSSKDLSKIFKNKFELVQKPVTDMKEVKKNKPSSKGDGEGGEIVTEETPSPKLSKHGKDVSDKFALASECNVQVFRKGKKYTIIEIDSEALLTGKPIEGKSKVVDFLNALLAEE